jgi:hypothetical protein
MVEMQEMMLESTNILREEVDHLKVKFDSGVKVATVSHPAPTVEIE